MKPSRQIERRSLFQAAFLQVSEDYGGMPRKNRRKIARAQMHSQWQNRQADIKLANDQIMGAA